MKTKTKVRKQKHKNQKENFKEGVKIWTTFWRLNPHRFVADYLQINLHIFQMMLIYMMDKSNFFMFIASRGELPLPHYIEIYSYRLRKIGKG